MADVLFIAITITFFVMCAGVVRLCDRIIGPDSEHLEPAEAETETVGAAR